MRGIILAGGTGSRMGDSCKVVNKHLLPVGGRPMIEWPLKVLRDNGITDITIVSTPRGIGQLAELLGGGYNYKVQDKPGGIAQAIACADGRSYEKVTVVLGDNIFLPSPNIYRSFVSGACCYLSKMPPEMLSGFGVPTFSEGGRRIIHVDEKPENPASGYAVTGLYIFSPDVFDSISGLRPSERGEIEVTDLLNLYATRGELHHIVLDGFWGDAGTIGGINRCEGAIDTATSWGKI